MIESRSMSFDILQPTSLSEMIEMTLGLNTNLARFDEFFITLDSNCIMINGNVKNSQYLTFHYTSIQNHDVFLTMNSLLYAYYVSCGICK